MTDSKAAGVFMCPQSLAQNFRREGHTHLPHGPLPALGPPEGVQEQFHKNATSEDNGRLMG